MKIHGDLGHIWRKVMQQYACDLTKWGFRSYMEESHATVCLWLDKTLSLL